MGLQTLYPKQYGITRKRLNQLFLGEMDSSIAILEAGTNIGLQLGVLQAIGFRKPHGIKPQLCAAKLLRLEASNIDVVGGTLLHIPCKTDCFDLVFTSDVSNQAQIYRFTWGIQSNMISFDY
jgi:hypothetical protein